MQRTTRVRPPDACVHLCATFHAQSTSVTHRATDVDAAICELARSTRARTISRGRRRAGSGRRRAR
eukprot:7683337-Alexandrium_andersonii.AAC.1